MSDASARLLTPNEPGSSPARCQGRAEVLAPFLRAGATGAEIGVFKGAFVEHLLASRPSKLYLVDPWWRLAPRWRWAKGQKSTVAAFRRILQVYQPEIEAGVIEPRVEFSVDFLAGLPDHALDWVYIDSSHAYEATKAELELCLRKVRPDGFILGDDFNANPEARHHGVYRAVKEFEAAGRIVLRLAGPRAQFAAALA